jgi:transposase
MLKNRIHNIIDRNHLTPPERTDIFGTLGKSWMKNLSLPDPDDKLLKSHLELLATVQAHVRQTESWVNTALKDNPNIPILESLPGIGKFFAALLALEIDTIDRFSNPGKLCSYSGLANSTYSSGGKTFHGGLIPTCNKHARWAFIEASWIAIRVSPYFSSFYKRLRARIGAQNAIGAVARKLCETTYVCLKHKREYREMPYRFRSGRLQKGLA